MVVKSMTQRIWLWLLVTGVLLLLLTEVFPWGHAVDMWFTQLLYDDATGRFVLLHKGWAEKYLHNLPQNVLRIVPVYMLIQVAYGGYLKWKTGLSAVQHEVWRRWIGLLAGAVATVVLVNLIKSQTNVACPWDLKPFGGEWTYVDLFTARPWAPKVIKCWPAGHGAAGFSIIAVAFVMGWPPAMWQKKLAAGDDRMPAWLGAKAFVWYALFLSTALGAVRILQGGHFLSHHLWALWWVLVVLMILVEFGVIKKRWLND